MKILTLLTTAGLFATSFLFAQTNFADPPVTGSPLTSGGDIDLFTAMWKQVVSSPASMLLILLWSIFAWLIDASFVTSRIIPAVCVLGGGASYWLFASPASVPHDFPHPVAVLVANGIVCGFVAYVIGFKAIKKFVLSRFNESGDPKPPPLPLILLPFLGALLVATPGCAFVRNSTPQKIAVTSLGTVQTVTLAAYDGYIDGVIQGVVKTNGVPAVSRTFDKFQSATLVALDGVQFNTNALAPASLMILSQDVLNLIANWSK